MFEMLLCSLVTLLPDYLFRRYGQGKRIGKEITLYSMWFELRWGITGCLILTILLITTVFYNHPSTTNVTLFFRTVPIISETTGRVADVYVGVSAPVKKGQPIFKLDSSKQEATSAHRQALDELETKKELQRRSPGIVPTRDIEKLQVVVDGRQAAISTARATKQNAEERVATLLPAQKASAEAALAQAQVELDKTVIRAGVDGRVEQFTLRAGDIVTPIMRSAGLLIPEGAGRRSLQAGFGQIEAQIMKAGMIAEVTCVSKPFTVIPMVVPDVQD